MITNTELEQKGNIFPSKIVDFKRDLDTFYFYTDNDVILQISIRRDSILRFRYTTTSNFRPDFSYAIDDNASSGYNELSLDEQEDAYIIITAKIRCHISKKDLKINIYNSNNKLILADELGFHWEESYKHGGDIVKMSKHAQDGESYFGLGDKPTSFNLKGKRFENWVTDNYAFAKNTDPLYKAIPFFVGLHHGLAYGVFFDNSFRSFFDFSQERRNVTSFWAHGGEMNYYFIYGPDMKDVVASYTDLTGKPEMPPLWTLGYHQCKWSYYPESKVREVTDKMRKLKIPCDAIYLDIDYMDGFRCFTWNKDYFPDPKKMVRELDEDGFKVVAIIDPGIKIDKTYHIYNEGIKNDYFCRRADGPLMRGKVWPGECNFPDFTKPEVRDWWASLFRELISDTGIRGIWNDMNEPAVMEVPNKTFPNDVRHDYDGNPCSHRKAHNIYGMQMARASYQGLKKYSHPKRPFLITRAAYSGGQRYSSTWTGDNVAEWEHLWIASVQCLRLSTSGFSFCGSDIGGFAQQPKGELFVRWIQLAAFHPFFRNHSSGDHGEQEPWSFGEEYTDITRKFIELRYQLLPYLYTAFHQYVTRGIPLLKPLVMYDQSDVQTHYRSDEFIVGEDILVCPILEPNAIGRRMYLPKGRWYNYWTDELVEGGREIWVNAQIDEIPVFIRKGSIIPKYPIQQYVGEVDIETITLHVYFVEGKSKSRLYEDAGDGYDYQKGRFNIRTFKMRGKPNELILTQHKSGNYQSSYGDNIIIKFHGLPFEISNIQLDNETVSFEALTQNGVVSLHLQSEFTELHILGI